MTQRISKILKAVVVHLGADQRYCLATKTPVSR